MQRAAPAMGCWGILLEAVAARWEAAAQGPSAPWGEPLAVSPLCKEAPLVAVALAPSLRERSAHPHLLFTVPILIAVATDAKLL